MKEKTLLAFVALAVVFHVSQARAVVDMRSANFSESWIDMTVKSAGYDLRIYRTYNSRTLYNGMFGFGWCTEFETKLKVSVANTLTVIDCGAGSELEYSTESQATNSTAKNISTIMAEVRKRNKGKDEKYFKGIEAKMQTDSELRDELAKQMNMPMKATKGTRYLANGRATDVIVFNGNEYTRTMANGSTQKFDKDGRLIQMADRNSNTLKITYQADKIVSVADNTGASLQFKYWDNTHYIKTATGPGALVSTYKYKGEDLIEVVSAWKNTYKYEYDNMYNMTKATYPDGTSTSLTYNKDKDWVTSFRDRNNCLEKYDYIFNDKDPLDNYSSTVEKECNGKVTNKSTFEFWYQKSKNGQRYLAKTRSIVNGHTTEIAYHEIFGRPIEVDHDGIATRLEYFANGQLKSKSEGGVFQEFAYKNTCNKLSEIVAKVSYKVATSTKGDRKPSKVTTKNQTKLITTNFSYDVKRCNLATVKNSDGQFAELSYDMRGRISRIVDQSKKEVTISYDERFGKPSMVSRPGLGTIHFKYKIDGTMEKLDVKENDDPTVAMQVADIFSNLLELIAPATADVTNI